jgi:hypothetical protein
MTSVQNTWLFCAVLFLGRDLTTNTHVPLHMTYLNTELNLLYHFLALLGAHPILHVSGERVKR